MRTRLRTALICLVGLVNVVSTTFPIWPRRYLLLTSVLPPRLVLTAQTLALFCGVLMIILAYPAAVGHRRAAWLLIGCGFVAVIMNLAKGLDIEEALVSLALVVAIIRGRKRFNDLPLRYTVVDLFRLVALLTLIGATYLAVARRVEALLRVARTHFLVIREHSDHAAKLVVLASHHLRMQHIFVSEASTLLPLFLFSVFLVASWTSLVRAQPARHEALYERFGRGSHNSLAYLANRHDTRTFLCADRQGAISFRLVGRVAVQVGAILGPAAERQRIYREFRAWCARERLVAAAVALAPDEREIVAAEGMRMLCIGREAVVDLRSFGVEQLGKKLRWASRSLTKRGYRCEVLTADEITPLERASLARLDADWMRARGSHAYGCAMTLGRFPGEGEHECLVGLMRDERGNSQAYLTLLPGGDGYYSLDITRRAQCAPNAAMEFLMTQTLVALRERGAKRVSLNFALFAGSLGGQGLARALSFAVQTRTLEVFNNKFLPEWQPRYLALPSWWATPDVLYAILILEGIDQVALAALTRLWRQCMRSARLAVYRAAEIFAVSGPTPAANRVSSGAQASAKTD